MGVVYALVAGQPLGILGTTGPALILDTLLFNFCKYVKGPIVYTCTRGETYTCTGIKIAIIYLNFILFNPNLDNIMNSMEYTKAAN